MGTGTRLFFENSTIFVDNTQISEIGEVIEDPSFNGVKDGFIALGSAARSASLSFIKFAHSLLGISAHLLKTCPNRHVVHLSQYGKNARIRNKNYKRMVKICWIN